MSFAFRKRLISIWTPAKGGPKRLMPEEYVTMLDGGTASLISGVHAITRWSYRYCVLGAFQVANGDLNGCANTTFALWTVGAKNSFVTSTTKLRAELKSR